MSGAQARNIALAAASDFESQTGRGIVGAVDGQRIALGNEHWMSDLAIDFHSLASRVDELRQDGQTVMYVGVEGRVAGLIGVRDPIKPSAAEALAALHEEGLRIVMVC